MPLSPEQEWTLVGCGLVAHADGILEVGEWEQVLWLLDERLGDHESKTWVDKLADHTQLRAHLESLQPPVPLFNEAVLEKAWRMALADGRGSDEEAKVHDDIATRLGVELAQVAGWREAWTERAARRSEIIAGVAAILAHVDGRTDPEERARYDELLERLPMEADRREALGAALDDPPPLDDIVGRLAALAPEDRRIALLGLVPIVSGVARGDQERQLFLDVADRVAISREDAERMLDR